MEDKNPVVIGRLGRNPDLPTVTFYGHYDVQPAMEREWATDPFEVAAIDGYFYGRGTSDNKACTLINACPICAIYHLSTIPNFYSVMLSSHEGSYNWPHFVVSHTSYLCCNTHS